MSHQHIQLLKHSYTDVNEILLKNSNVLKQFFVQSALKVHVYKNFKSTNKRNNRSGTSSSDRMNSETMMTVD